MGPFAPYCPTASPLSATPIRHSPIIPGKRRAFFVSRRYYTTKYLRDVVSCEVIIYLAIRQSADDDRWSRVKIPFVLSSPPLPLISSVLPPPPSPSAPAHPVTRASAGINYFLLSLKNECNSRAYREAINKRETEITFVLFLPAK